MRALYVVAQWDHECDRWWAVGADETYICAEASTVEDLKKNLQAVVADLFIDYPRLAETYDSIRIFFNREEIIPLA